MYIPVPSPETIPNSFENYLQTDTSDKSTLGAFERGRNKQNEKKTNLTSLKTPRRRF